MKQINLFTIILVLLATSTFAQFGVQKDLVKIKTYQSFDKVYPGTEFKLAVEAEVAESWHINSDKPYDEYLIPTSLMVPENPNFKLIKSSVSKTSRF